MTHPRRRQWAARLATSIDATLIQDPDPAGPPSALRCAMEAWTRPISGRYSHRLVVQDDALLCQNFLAAARIMLTRYPTAMIAFYVGNAHPGGWHYHTAARRCEHVCPLPLHHFVPTVCLAMPIPVAEAWAAWTQANVVPGYPYDDEAFRMYREVSHVPALATIPCLAQHTNHQPSLIGHQHHGRRQAACWIGDHDPTHLWT